MGGTLFGGVEKPSQNAAPGRLKRRVTSGPVLGTLAVVILTVGFTAFLLMDHAAKSTARAPEQAPKESIQDAGASLPPVALSGGEKSSTVNPSVEANAARKDGQAGARPEPAPSAQIPATPSAKAVPAPSSEEGTRTVARTFAPPNTRGASPEIGPILDAPPALPLAVPIVPSATIAPEVGALPSRITPPPPAPVAPPATARNAVSDAPPRQINAAGSVQATKLIKKVTPAYPALARAARLEGTVRFRAVIGVDGQVKGLVTLSGPPPLVQPAADAVKQWRYQPTVRNGEALEVVTEIDVAFAR
ncbi:MAG TPA: TonB family protein [Bryobacteraceae bacterium]|nr:TonB family protein [Bryobacteraceae bacterium]